MGADDPMTSFEETMVSETTHREQDDTAADRDATNQGSTAAEPTADPAPPMTMKAKGNSSRWVFGAVVICAALALFWPSSGGKRGYLDGKLYDSGEHEVFLSTRMAKVTLIHFWSTWCLPCLEELPEVQRLKDDYADNPDFTLIFVAVADDEKKVADLLGDRLHETLFDPDWQVTKRFDTHKLPESHIVVDGRIVDSFIGVTDWGSAPVRQRIDAALRAADG